MRAWGKCLPRPRRLLNYALAVTTAVKNATVIININIVTALIACVVISPPYCLSSFLRSKLADRSRLTGVEVVSKSARPLRRFLILIRD
jgi:hypothetical protein